MDTVAAMGFVKQSLAVRGFLNDDWLSLGASELFCISPEGLPRGAVRALRGAQKPSG
jgi:hypothetical protein